MKLSRYWLLDLLFPTFISLDFILLYCNFREGKIGRFICDAQRWRDRHVPSFTRKCLTEQRSPILTLKLAWLLSWHHNHQVAAGMIYYLMPFIFVLHFTLEKSSQYDQRQCAAVLSGLPSWLARAGPSAGCSGTQARGSTFLLSEVKLTLKPTFKWRWQGWVGEYHDMFRVVLGTHQVQEWSCVVSHL